MYDILFLSTTFKNNPIKNETVSENIIKMIGIIGINFYLSNINIQIVWSRRQNK